MTEQSKIDPKQALAALEQAYGYYQPEPVLVQDNSANVVDDLNDDLDGFAYYHAA
ncbi:hypothetical protein Q4543_02580 [Salipiger sp. 1_MG-2023]|uniref:hypothetical protein n=1 Tax=Salipiger sp. 1_MG-2023 TaxID=3062665 RepID=UPI0026E17C76|nr:hypothetical protein [Salipiger sp. 1_MG-2023]MDO6584393.1 hypothetical protein [Salipiger sp. 1_MG-2023]